MNVSSVPPKFPARKRHLALGAAQALLRALWLFVVPGLLAVLTLRYFVPGRVEATASGWENALARIFQEQPVPLALGVFLLWAALAQYWRYRLPGGRFLAPIPVELAAQVEVSRLDEFAKAVTLQRRFEKRSFWSELDRRLEPAARGELDLKLASLRDALASTDAERVQKLRPVVEALAAPVLRVQERWRSGLFLVGLGFALGAALFVRERGFHSYRVLSSSMLPTLQPGDLVAGNKAAYGLAGNQRRLPERAEVIVFRRPSQGSAPEDLVKRVIGVPGDRISILAGRPVINGWGVPNCKAGTYFHVMPGQPPVRAQLAVEFLRGQAYLTAYASSLHLPVAYEVKEGEVFVLGDNRNLSLDSRGWTTGTAGGVAARDILARVDRLLVHTTREGTLSLDTLLQPLSSLRLNLDHLDTQDLDQRIKQCLANRPKQTEPPHLSVQTPQELAHQRR